MAQIDSAAESDVDRENLSQQELNLLETSLQRGFEFLDTEASVITRDDNGNMRSTDPTVVKTQEYLDEIVHAAEIARAQFDERFGGMNPKRGRFQITRIHAGYFGWDSWESFSSIGTAGTTVNWLDAGTPDHLSGSTGINNPLKVGEDAVHVVFSTGTYHDSPKVSRLDYEINEEPRANVNVKYEWTKSNLASKYFDSTWILPENAKLGAQWFAENTGQDFPYLGGVSFIKSDSADVADPANMANDGTSTSDVIVART